VIAVLALVSVALVLLSRPSDFTETETDHCRYDTDESHYGGGRAECGFRSR
jgi:hypothetical protein